MGVAYGSSFQLIKSARIGRGVACTTILPRPGNIGSHEDVPHPIIIDCCYQSAVYAMEYELMMMQATDALVPYRCESLVFKPELYYNTKSVHCCVRRSQEMTSADDDDDDEDGIAHFDIWASHHEDDDITMVVPFLVVRDFVITRAPPPTPSPSLWHTLRWECVDANDDDDDDDDNNNNSSDEKKVAEAASNWLLVGTKRAESAMKSLKRLMKKHCCGGGSVDGGGGVKNVSEYAWASLSDEKFKAQRADVVWWICDDECIDSLMEFCQRIIVHSKSDAPVRRVCIVTYDCNMDGQAYRQGHVLGFVRSFRSENPQIRAQLLDVASDDDTATRHFVVVLAHDEDELVIRGGRLFAPRVVSVAGGGGSDIVYRVPSPSNVVYMVVGGTGGLGLRIGAWLVAQGAACVCLVSHGGRVHANDQWLLEEMRRRSSSVLLRKCNVTVLSEVKALFKELAEEHGPVGGIVFGAAAWADGKVAQMDAVSLSKAMNPKKLGTMNVHLVSRNASSPLEFFVALSSITSVVGAPNVANYNAGNSFQESLMAYRQRLGLPGAVLHLGGVVDAGHMVVMAKEEMMTFDAEYMLSTGDVLKALASVITAPTLHTSLIVHKFSESDVDVLSKVAKFASVSAIPSLKSRRGFQLNMSRDELFTTVRDVLNAYAVTATDCGDDTPFMEMGIDSMALSSIVSVLNTRLSITLPIAVLLQNNTVNTIVRWLEVHTTKTSAVNDADGSDEKETDGLPGIERRKLPIDDPSDDDASAQPQLGIGMRWMVQCACLLLAGLVAAGSAIPAYHMMKYLLEHGFDDAPWAGIYVRSGVRGRPYHMLGVITLLAVPLWALMYTCAVVLVKWTIVGRYRSCVYRMHSWRYYQWLSMDVVLNVWNQLVGMFINDTFVQTVFYKAMGADIPWSFRTSASIREFDVLHVQSHTVSLAGGRSVFCRLMTADYLWMDHVRFDGAHISCGTRCVVLTGVVVASNVTLRPMAVVIAGSVLEANGVYDGNPACRVDDATAGATAASAPDWRYIFTLDTLTFGGFLSMFWTLNVCSVPMTLLLDDHPLPDGRYQTLYYHVLQFVSSLALLIFVLPIVKWTLFGRVRESIYLDSAFGAFSRWLIDMMYLTWALRMGCFVTYSQILQYLSIACGASWNVLTAVTPFDVPLYQVELLDVDDHGGFISDLVFDLDHPCPPPRTADGVAMSGAYRERRVLHVGVGASIGLRVVVRGGRLDRFNMVGALSRIDVDRHLKPNSNMVGVLPIVFGGAVSEQPVHVESAPPLRQGPPSRGAGGSDIALDDLRLVATQQQQQEQRGGTLERFVLMCVDLLLAMVVMAYVVMVAVIPPFEFGRMMVDEFDVPIEVTLLMLGVELWLFVGTVGVLCIVYKWVVFQRIQPASAGVDSSMHYYSRGMWSYRLRKRPEFVAALYYFSWVNGTMFANLAHRLEGSRISYTATLHSQSIQDGEMVEIGDEAVVDYGAYVLGHYFTRELVVDRVHLGRRAVQQPYAMSLGRSNVDDDSTLGVSSTMFNGQAADGGSHWQGVPAALFVH